MSIVTKEHQLGALIGALVGDASGAVLEFYRGEITNAVVRNAMQMKGGGALNMAPGQCTDDGELTLSLISALKKHNVTDIFPIIDIMTAYKDWVKSEPFDCGFTCRKAFGTYSRTGGVREALDEVSHINAQSEANGALMRATPIPVFYHQLPNKTLALYAQLDAQLSHPNKICQDVNVLYSIAIAELIRYPRDYEGAVTMVEEFISNNDIHRTVELWFEDSKKDLKDIDDCTVNIGHVKHAFTLAFHFLIKGETYENAIFQTLLRGGDTDTNACIVGGMMGALYGFHGIPEEMRETVLDFDCSTHDPWITLIGHKRPAIYKSMNAYDFIMSK